jgi:hypothetical protein
MVIQGRQLEYTGALGSVQSNSEMSYGLISNGTQQQALYHYKVESEREGELR